MGSPKVVVEEGVPCPSVTWHSMSCWLSQSLRYPFRSLEEGARGGTLPGRSEAEKRDPFGAVGEAIYFEELPPREQVVVV
jgi:hypothetical protein